MRPLALILCVLLAACAKPTAYVPADPAAARPEGYAEARIEPGRWRVSFAGNSATSRDAVKDALLHRAAEVTLREGGEWFMVVDDDLETDIRHVAVGTDYFGYPSLFRGGRRGLGYVPFSGFATLDTREIKRFAASAEILVMRGPKPAGEGAAYEARAVIADVGKRLTRAAG